MPFVYEPEPEAEWVVKTLIITVIESNNYKKIDYIQLEEFLSKEKWKDADEETARIIFKIAGRENERWLRPEDIEVFPSNELQTIDKLWVKYSKNHFGFSVQKEIYQSLGGTKEYNQEITQQFWRKTGLVTDSQAYWSQYNSLTFDLSAPRGHLPINYDINTPSGVYGVIESLLSRQDLGLTHKLIEENIDRLKELIVEQFLNQEYEFELNKHPEDYDMESIQEVIPAENEKIEVSIIDYTLENFEENTVILSLEIEIKFSIEIHYSNWEAYIPQVHESDVPYYKHIFSNQRVQGKANTNFWISNDYSESEFESIDLDIDEPIEVNDNNIRKPGNSAELENYLKNGQWKEADRETYRLMILTVGKEEGQWLDGEDLENFPCEDLRTINQLWLDYSDNKFGFSVQKEIYESLERAIESSQEVWENFCKRVGWINNGKLLLYSDLTFNLNLAPKAHLPTPLSIPAKKLLGLGWETVYGDRLMPHEYEARWVLGLVAWDHLFSRAKTCNL